MLANAFPTPHRLPTRMQAPRPPTWTTVPLQRKIDNVDVSLAARADDSAEGCMHLARLVQLLLVTAVNTPLVANEVTQGILGLPQGVQDALMTLIEDGFADLGVDIEGAGGDAPMESTAVAAAEPVGATTYYAAGAVAANTTPGRKRPRSGLTPAKLRSLGNTPGRAGAAPPPQPPSSSSRLFGAGAAALSGIPPTGRRSVTAARSGSFDSSMMLSALAVGSSSDGEAAPGGGGFTYQSHPQPPATSGRPTMSVGAGGGCAIPAVRGGAAAGASAAVALERDNAALREEVVRARGGVGWALRLFSPACLACCLRLLPARLNSPPSPPYPPSPPPLAHAHRRRTCARSWTPQSAPRSRRSPARRQRLAGDSLAATTTTTTPAAAAAAACHPTATP